MIGTSRHEGFAKIPDAVVVGVVEDAVLLAVEPLEDRYFDEVAAAVGRVAGTAYDRDPLEGDDEIEGRVPDHELVVAVGNVRDREVALAGRRRGVDGSAGQSAGHLVQTHPWGGVTEAGAVVESVVRRPRHVVVDDFAAEGGRRRP